MSDSIRTVAKMIIMIGLSTVSPVADANEPSAQQTYDDPFDVPATAEPITVDGRIDELAWTTALKLELLYEVHPAESAPAQARTEVLITHDDATLYVAFRAFDPEPSAIRARVADHDSAWRDDRVGILVDTFNDQRRCFNLMVNPFGSQMDFIKHGNNIDDIGWDAIWDSAGRITDWGWAAEFGIPFRSLRFQHGNGPQVWGFNAYRYYPRDKQHWMSITPEDRSNDCLLCQIRKIRGFSGVEPGRSAEIVPAITAQRMAEREDTGTGGSMTSAEDIELGVTGSWGVTPNMTLSGALNPDFSQVEADALQLEVNQPFALFYPERRPFFTEAADYFYTPLNIVHTRSVRDPSWGLKLTGKQSGTTVGGFIADDKLTSLLLPGSQWSQSMSLPTSSLATVIRVRRDLWDNSSLGLVATGRDGEDYFNRVAGVDGDFRITPSDRITAQVLASSTSYPDAAAIEYEQPEGRFRDYAAQLEYTHTTRSLSWFAGYELLGPNFRADVGFLPRVGYSQTQLGLGYRWTALPEQWWSFFQVQGSFTRSNDHDGGLLNEETRLTCSLAGNQQISLTPDLMRGREGYNGEVFDVSSVSLWGEIRPSGDLGLRLGAMIGDRIDYANTRLGRSVRLNPMITWRAWRRLRLYFQHTFERMEVDQGWLYTAKITYLSAVYNFSLRTSLRAVLQYQDNEYAPELYSEPVEPRERRLFTELLFSYKLNPRTVVFVGYSDGRYGERDLSLTQEQRSVFVKLGYAWLL
jgi:hypothetical protein